MFATELQYFIKNQPSLVAKYDGKILVLRKGKLAAVYDDACTAYLESKQKYGAGNFMIQPCVAGPDAYTVSISAANSIAR